MSADLFDLETQISELLSRAEIGELRARYAMDMALVGGGQIADLFSEDGVFQTLSPAGSKTIAGRPALREFFAAIVGGLRIPLVHNEVLRLNGETAEGSCAMYSPVAPDHESGFCGYYDETFQRVDGRWLFSRRSFRKLWPR